MDSLAKRKKIKDFSQKGEAIDQEAILRLKKEIEDRLVEFMREKGYVPVIDILPQLFWEYDKNTTNFKYEIVIYGSYVGKQKSQQILGLLDSRPISFES